MHRDSVNFVDYYSLIMAVVKHKRKICHLRKDSEQETQFHASFLAITKHIKGTKWIYNKLLCSQIPSTCIKNGKNFIQTFNGDKFSPIHLLLQLQDSDFCTFCAQSKKSIKHFLYVCIIVTNIWNDLCLRLKT